MLSHHTISVFSLGLSLAILTSATPVPIDSASWLPGLKPLRFRKDGTFQLSIFEDLHYAEGPASSWGPKHDSQSTTVMDKVLTAETPDLVVLNGDLITGEDTFRHNSTAYLDQLVAPMLAHNTPWASAYGNHDSNFNLSRAALWAREQRHPLSRTGYMVPTPSAGITNYFLPVFGADADADTARPAPELLLWFFDSRGAGSYQLVDAAGRPNWVDASVVRWFADTRALLRALFGRDIPSLAFVHIPTEASRAFQTNGGVDKNTAPGINDDSPDLAQQALRQDGTYGGEDVPFMAELVKTEGLMGVFSGHDHGNDWCGKWDEKYPNMTIAGNGLNLCFGRHTGYGGYGTWTRGARQILVDMKTVGKSVDTWIRLEDGKVSGRVSLNATYGVDRYPEVENTSTGNKVAANATRMEMVRIYDSETPSEASVQEKIELVGGGIV